MVKRYEPVLSYFDEWSDYPNAEMKESKHGQWVKLETYNHVVAQFSAKEERLRNEISRLYNLLKEQK